MAEVIPFRGITYDRTRVSGDEVTAPPYDLITAGMREALYARSPYNVTRVDFGKELPGDGDEENKYARAARHLGEWQGEKVLRRSGRPVFYAYRMTYDARGVSGSVTGLFGLVRLVELGDGVYPHEATHSKPKSDRLALMEATGANTSPIFSLFSSPEGGNVRDILAEASSREPSLSATDPDGTVHSLWEVGGQEQMEAIGGALAGAPIFIADGHHRYETALEYQRLMAGRHGTGGGPAPWDYVLMFLADLQDPGLAVLPTHRAVTLDVSCLAECLAGHFEMDELPEGDDIMSRMAGREHSFGLYADGRSWVLRYRGGDLSEVDPALRELDVVVLHKLVFGRLLDVGAWAYEMEPGRVRAMVDEGEYDAAFFLNPTPVKDVEAVALSGLRMPPKSTYFYPKVQTGFVMNDLTSF